MCARGAGRVVQKCACMGGREGGPEVCVHGGQGGWSRSLGITLK